MPTNNIPAVNFQPGTERHSASVTLNSRLKDVEITLTDPNNVWNTTVGNIVQWGVQISHDGGTTWDWWIFQTGLAFGSRTKSGGMPSLTISSDTFLGNEGNQARLAMTVDTAIRLGATVVTTPVPAQHA